MIDSIKTNLKAGLETALSAQFNKPISVIVEEPKRPNQGDISIPVFAIAKAIDLSLPETVVTIKDVIKTSGLAEMIADISTTGGFINLFLNKAIIAKGVFEAFADDEENYGSTNTGTGKTVCIDYSSPNIAKPFSIGHLRSTIIGAAIGNLYEKCGFTVVRINHLGDFGTQFGKIIYAYQHFGNEELVKKDPINELVKLYVEFHELVKTNPEMDNEARRIFKELEQGNPEYVTLWNWFREVSLADYMKVYELLNVKFDSYNGEAFYNDKMQPIIDELAAKGLLKEDQGAMIVDLGEQLPPALIQKSDGSTLYITRDLAALFYRKQTYHFSRCLYVVGNEQKLHFEQLKAVVKKMGYNYYDEFEHVNFGLVLQDGKKMSTRKGKVVKLIDVLNEAIDLSKQHIEEKNPELKNKDEIAQKIGVSAIIFNDLKNYRANDFEFDLEDMVKFEGQTGPYLQYTSVRITSILAADQFQYDGDIDFELMAHDIFFDIIKTAGDYAKTIEKATKEASPSLLAKYLLNLAALFNSLYGKERIAVSDMRERKTKEHLLYLIRSILNDGMRILGMQTIEKM
ncbi:MAG: arginine--tRNA ligase [Candidatus Izemoplasmatales bacterium]|jgi:arginyl-tRNA synthetase|nr:arginine--tRNA ligase [Candidatus Izemoplasmatales bacterium]MDD4596275.1 arginine--tRNA ligase [Candidatus Izemoplasmatales bacterium]